MRTKTLRHITEDLPIRIQWQDKVGQWLDFSYSQNNDILIYAALKQLQDMMAPGNKLVRAVDKNNNIIQILGG